MNVHLDISNTENFGFASIVKSLTDYSEELRIRKEKRKAEKLESNQRAEVKAFFDDLLHKPSVQRDYFEFASSSIEKEGNKLLHHVDKELAIWICDSLEKQDLLKKLVEAQDDYSRTDFDDLEEFYAYNSFMRLVHTITDLYEAMKEKALELESEDYLSFIEGEINKSIKSSDRQTIDSIEDFLSEL